MQTEEDEDKLQYYETNAYESNPCLITLKGQDKPVVVQGKTFMYAGDAESLREGRFDRILWAKQMSGKFPVKLQ